MAKKKLVIGERRENERALLALSPERWIEMFNEEFKRHFGITTQEGGAEEWARGDAQHGVLLPEESALVFGQKYDLIDLEREVF